MTTFAIAIMKNKILFAIVLFAAISCTEDRVDEFTPSNPETTPEGVEIVPGIIKVNEFSATGTDTANHHGDNEEWLEIYNTTDENITLEEGKWFVTDHGWDNPNRYEIPKHPITDEYLQVPPGEFLFIWCDNNDEIVFRQGNISVHTNFSLAQDGEDIGIFYQQKDGRFLRIDGYKYEDQREGISEGRSPDGSNNWKFFENPTPGKSNN